MQTHYLTLKNLASLLSNLLLYPVYPAKADKEVAFAPFFSPNGGEREILPFLIRYLGWHDALW